MQFAQFKNFIIIHRKEIGIYILALGFSFLITLFAYIYKEPITKVEIIKLVQVSKLTPTPAIIPFITYTKPILEKSDRYDIYLIGDSMMNAFGPRGGLFNEIISKTYPDTFFEVSNYAQANQSILLLPQRLKEPVQAAPDLLLVPIIEGEPDLIIIESFGYNPLSQFGTEEGLKEQEKVLTEVMTTLTNRFPNTVIMFLAAIAPDKKTYGQSVNSASADERWAQAEERIEYITNHIDYANEHNIPLINAYEKSLDTDGDGNTIYINPDDNIHPSAEGLSLMGTAMTEKIKEENIFP